MPSFTDILGSLNNRQLEAVETIYWPVLVIAGPGSGKTQLLAARIANILLTTDYLPSNILCLTFTENAARNMRERLASMIGQDAYRVAIHTFHSFGNEILNRFRTLSKQYNEAEPIDTIESSRILDQILSGLAWDNPYKPWFRASETIKDVLGSIGNLKKWWVTPSLYREILKANTQTLLDLEPLVEQYWSQIDVLGQKKEDKEKKIQLFEEFTNMVRQLNEKWVIDWSQDSKHWTFEPLSTHFPYDSFHAVLNQSLTESWETYTGDGSTKFMNSWRDSWTERTVKGKRVLKEQGKLPKQQALAEIYESYQKTLTERGLIDFSDMILQAIELVEEYDIVRMSLAEQYQFIMIDEFQDTNDAQMRLVNGVTSVGIESPNIFAVGDDDQSIYKFQWANTKNIRHFHDTYQDTRLIILEKNYRSKSEIIHHSRAVIISESNNIGNIFEWVMKQFEAVRAWGGSVRKRRFRNELEEQVWIIEDIASKIADGVAPENIAIITKKNKTLELYTKWLLEKGIEVVLSKDESIFEDESIMLVIHILELIDSMNGSYAEEDKELLVTILSHPAFAINRLILWNISKSIYHARKDTNRSWIESLAHHEDQTLRNTANFLKELSIRALIDRLEDIIDSITGANSLSLPDDYDDDGKTNPLQIDMFSGERTDFVSPLYSHFFDQLLNHKWSNIAYARHLANMRAFIEWVRKYKHGKPFLILHDAIEILSLINTYDLDISASHIIGDERKSVNLITVYKAKWLEWDHVYVPSLTRSEYKLGKIGWSSLPKNLPLEAERDNDEDIERLVYTAFTRAKDTLTVSYADETIAERPNEPLACIEIEHTDWEEVTTVPITELTSTLEVEKQSLFSLPYLGEENNFLRDRIEKIFVMNATALQNFLNVADAGPEYFVSNSLLRFPQAKNISASYGSAIHQALEDFFSDYSKKWTFMKSLLFESFENSLKKEGFDRETESTYLARGQDNLDALYGEIVGRSYGELSLEYDFRAAHGGVFLVPDEGSSFSRHREEWSKAEWRGDPEFLDSSTLTQNDDTKNQEPRTKNPGAIQLTGKIDRIERLPDDTLIITDYKTGSGFDSFDGRGAEYEKIKQWKYRLQLCFYAILFELSPRWRMFQKRQFELFFVEKNRDEDRFHRISEYIQQGEIERTKKLIIAVMSRIQNLDFPDIRAYPKTLEGIRMFEEDLLNNLI